MIYKFFTFWVFLLVLFSKYTYKYFNLEYLTFIVLTVGLYLSYINPRFYRFELFGKQYELRDTLEKFFIADLIFHIATFYYVYEVYGDEYRNLDNKNNRTLNSLLLLLVYYLLIDFDNLYNINKKELTTVFLVANIIYFSYKIMSN
jgi:hypothetical protein